MSLYPGSLPRKRPWPVTDTLNRTDRRETPCEQEPVEAQVQQAKPLYMGQFDPQNLLSPESEQEKVYERDPHVMKMEPGNERKSDPETGRFQGRLYPRQGEYASMESR